MHGAILYRPKVNYSRRAKLLRLGRYQQTCWDTHHGVGAHRSHLSCAVAVDLGFAYTCMAHTPKIDYGEVFISITLYHLTTYLTISES